MITESEYIEQRLDQQQAWYDDRARSNRRWYMWLRTIEVLVAAAIPFVTTLLTANPSLTWLVALLAFVIAAVSGLVALHKYQDSWVEYRATAEALKREKLLFLTGTPPYDGADPFHTLVERVETLLARESAGWMGYMKQAGSPVQGQSSKSMDQAPVDAPAQKQ